MCVGISKCLRLYAFIGLNMCVCVCVLEGVYARGDK